MKMNRNEKKWIKARRERAKVCQKSEKILRMRKASKPSRGEQRIVDFLVKECVNFYREFFMTGCYSKSKRLLFFDFYLPDFNLCIEFDGEQHYSKNKPQNQQENDFIKNAYCKKNGIHFLRIKFDRINDIEEMICKKLDFISPISSTNEIRKTET
jgi:very-short-patch-repair endonuclease